jgi:dihydrofolate reductase
MTHAIATGLAKEAMRKIIEETLVSLDGVIEDPAQWVGDYFDDAFLKATFERLAMRDAMLMGRRTYEVLAKDWAAQTGEYADAINGIRKYVFSSTLETAAWSNSTLISGDVAAGVTSLKEQAGSDLVIWGHGLLGQTLLAHGLLDELRITIFPVVVGRGKLLFRENESTTLKLIAAESLSTGAVVLRYEPAGSNPATV